MKQFIIPVFFMGLLLSSCSDDECESLVNEDLVPVMFSPIVADINQVDTRAVKTTWAQGDQIAIFSDIAVKKDGNTSISSITYTRGATEGTWNSPSEDERWYFADAVNQHNFYAYYPVGTATRYTAVELPDISGQDATKTLTTLKEEKDFMRGAAVVTKGNIAASLQMFRVFTIINFKIKLKLNAFTSNAATLSEIKLISTGSLPLVNPTTNDKATVDLSNGQITCTTGLTSPTFRPASGIALSTTEVSIPVKIYAHRSTIQVQFTIDGKTSTTQTLSTTNFVGGRIYNYSVEVNAGLSQLGIGDPIIFDWMNSDGTPISPVIPN